MPYSPERLLAGLRHLERLPEVWRCSHETADWPRLTAAYIGIKTDIPFRVSLRSGNFEFHEHSDIPTFWQVFFRRIYPVYRSDQLIVDAGANIGTFSLYALATAPACRLIGIEPAPDSFLRLRNLLQSHGFAERCTLYEAALGDCDGETCINLAPASQFRQTGGTGHPVRMRRLESVIPAAAEVDLLKMDIEGGEYAVLRSARVETLRQIRRIVMEYHPHEPASNAIQPLLAVGFRVTQWQDDGNGYGVVTLKAN